MLNECQALNVNLNPLVGKERSLIIDKLTPDVFANKIIPNDIHSDTNIFAVKTRKNGDCLFGCGSVFACGKDDDLMACELRLSVVVELAIHADYYLEEKNIEKVSKKQLHLTNLSKPMLNAMYSDKYNPSVHFDPRSIFIQETLHCAKQLTLAGIWQIHALSSVLGMQIFSVYPKLGASEVSFVRKHLNRLLIPREMRSQAVGHILWCNIRSLTPMNWHPNHFAPCLPFSKKK